MEKRDEKRPKTGKSVTSPPFPMPEFEGRAPLWHTGDILWVLLIGILAVELPALFTFHAVRISLVAAWGLGMLAAVTGIWGEINDRVQENHARRALSTPEGQEAWDKLCQDAQVAAVGHGGSFAAWMGFRDKWLNRTSLIKEFRVQFETNTGWSEDAARAVERFMSMDSQTASAEDQERVLGEFLAVLH